MAILSLKRWEREAYEVSPGVNIHLKLKRLKRAEAKPLAKILIKVFAEFEKARAAELTDSQKASILAQAYEVIPEDELKRLFAACVKDVEDFEIDGDPITTGAALLEEADDNLLFWLLMRLHTLSRLTGAEGKALALPSPSPATPEANGSGSTATSTEHEAGPRLSIVRESSGT